MSGPRKVPREPPIELRTRITEWWSRHYVGAAPERFGGQSIAVAVGLVLLLCTIEFTRCLLDNDGFLTPDSTNYLTLAANLDLGHGFEIAGDGRFPARFHHFAEWPVGYPYLIHTMSWATGASPFVASKLVNMALVLFSALLLAKTFGRNGPLFVLIFGFASYLDIFSYTWSEAPFIFLLLSASVLLAGFIGNSEKARFVRSLLLAACCVGLFLSRYVGAFAIALTGIVALLSIYRRQYALALLNFVLLASSAAIIGLYLHGNAVLTHFATGMPRLPPTDSAGARLAMLAGALWSEAVLPLVEFRATDWSDWLVVLFELIGIAAVARSISRRDRHWRRAIRIDALALSFFLVGTLYLAAIIALRWLNQFDPYNFRLLGPGTLLLDVAILRVALLSWPAATRAIAAFTGAMAALSLGLAIRQTADLPGPGYLANVRRIEARYARLPAGSIILFGNDHLRYLRPDLFVTLPMCPPWYDSEESWGRFLSQIDKRRPVFVDISGPALDAAGCHPSIRAFLARHRPGELFRLAL